MEAIYVVGVGMTPFGRHLDKSVKQLTALAVNEALTDATLTPSSVDVAFFGNSTQGFMQGQLFVRGQMALLPNGFEGIPIHNVENACATASTAFHLAYAHLRAGMARVALAVGAEKMVTPDKAKMLAVFDSGWDIETVSENRTTLLALGEGVEVPDGTTADRPYSVFMDVYAALGRQLMRKYGVTQRQIAAVAAKNHRHSVHNDRSQYRTAMTIDEVLAAAPITYPLTLPMCAPISDGGAAAILCTESGLTELGLSRLRAVRIRASVMKSASRRPGDAHQCHITRRAALAAFEEAQVAPSEIHVAELHDATAIGELIQMENLRLCPEGESGRVAESGATELGGRLPINPSGGLESKGHPIGATGLGQIYELLTQLRGEAGARQASGARMAIQENGGGLWGVEEAAAHVAILEGPSR
jgi:acetyl-CoA acetyltransferase